MKKQKSFTLIELMVVISIIGLISSIVLVAAKNVREKAKRTAGLHFAAQVHHALGNEAVGLWDFDEGAGNSASDASGYNNTISIGAVGSNVNWDTGINGMALNYLPSAKTAAAPCPTGAYLSVSSSNQIYNLPQSQFTFAAWLKVSVGGTIVKFNTQYSIPGCCNGFWINTGSTAIANNAGSNTPVGASIPADNSWHHFVYTFNLPTLTHQTYVDGKLYQSAPNLSGSYGNISKVNLGIYDTHWCGAGHAMTGLIDEVRIYGQALTSAQVEALYAEGAARHGLLAEGESKN